MVSYSGSLVQLRCGEGGALLSPSTLLYMERALRCTRFQPSGVPQKCGVGCAFVPSQTRATQASRSLTGALSLGVAHLLSSAIPASVSIRASRVHAPSSLRVPSSRPHLLCLGACTLCLAVTLPADVADPESQEVFD